MLNIPGGLVYVRDMDALPSHNGAALPVLFSEVRVRPILADERRLWDELMRRHHYLGFNRTAARVLRQVTEYRERWLALLLWQASALRCAPRDRCINWARAIQFQRLHRIANNARFLILPEGRILGLASRVLGLSLRRLSHDWQAVHGHPWLLAETFVDPKRLPRYRLSRRQLA
ncbi:MAG: Druantia anti-phage system protein DruA, partial [Blastocatellia bacterium]